MEPEMMEQEEQQNEKFTLSKEEELDADIAAGLLARLILSEKGVKAIKGLGKASNPIPGIANLLAQSVTKIAQRLQGTEMDLSPSVWLSENGAVDRAIDDVAMVIGDLSEQEKNAIFSDTIDQLKMGGNVDAQAAQQPQEPPPVPQGGPMPQGAPMPQGGPPSDPMMGGMPA